MNFQEIVNKVPDYQTFLTVEEMDESTRKLAADFPEVVTVFEAGKSRKGHSILCLKIGEGSKNALCFACPHPNEPIGAMTMEFFSRELAENKRLRDELDFTWYIIKCVDPDGVRLNEKWFKGPFNLYTYTRNYFRPAGYEQVEWTFPIDYKELHFHNSLPETEALMKIIDETKPAFMYSLHNAGFGGAYWYLTHDIPKLYEDLLDSARKQDVSLSLGEPEEPYVTKFAPAIFKNLGIKQMYDYTEKYTGKKPQFESGACSAEYASTKTDCVTLLTELPYFFDSRIEDMNESSITRKAAILQNVDLLKKDYAMIDDLLHGVGPYISNENPFFKLVDQIIKAIDGICEAKANWASSNKEFETRAKESELFDNLYTTRFYNGLSLGLAVRACEYELEKLTYLSMDDEVYLHVKYTFDKGLRLLKEYCEDLENELNYTVIPIQKLVRIQLESGLIVSNYISKYR